MKPLAIGVLVAVVGGCGLGLPASRPSSGEGDVVVTDVSVDLDFRDTGSPIEVTDAAEDGDPIFGPPDVAFDAADDVRSLPEGGMDAADAIADMSDPVDASVAMDTVDVTEAFDAADAFDVTDVTDVTDAASDVRDVIEVTTDAVDVVAPPCPGGGVLCNGACVNIASDERNCGRCGRACSAIDTCIAGGCGLGTCASGTADCDGRRTNGCEVNLAIDEGHCGRCDNPCAVSNGTSQCRSGACVITSCVAPRANCDGRYDTGCETDTTAAAAHCGACGNACLSNICRSGVCWNVAGSYDAQDLALCGAACVPNTYTGSCTCPAGYVASTLRRLAPCSVLANPTAANLSVCGSSTPGTFGGLFQSDTNCDQPCVTPNVYTRACACPAGTTGLMNFELLADTTCGRSRAVRTYLCGRVSSGANHGGGFGGAYLLADPASGMSACRQGNPFVTGSPCACPTGYGSVLNRVLIPQSAVPGYVSGLLVLCLQ
jgi:hypothetical protein